MVWDQLNCRPPPQQLSVCVVNVLIAFCDEKIVDKKRKNDRVDTHESRQDERYDRIISTYSNYDKARVVINIVRFPSMYILALSGEERRRRRLQPYPRTLDVNVLTIIDIIVNRVNV